MNWKASIDFPYMGQFLPPVKDDEKWNRLPEEEKETLPHRTKGVSDNVDTPNERLFHRHARPGFSRSELL